MFSRTLGRTGIQVSQIGYGSWAIGGDAWGPQDDQVSIATLHRALDQGCTFIDTALSYGSGRSEQLVGQVLAERGKKVILATKVPPKNEIWGPSPHVTIEEEFPTNWIVECCEKSLHNLQTDCIDVLLFHTWNMSWSHEDQWLTAVERLKRDGKIKAIGVSVHDELVSQANVHIEAGRIDVIEVVYNVFQQLPRYELFPLALKYNVGIIARAPLQAGILTGKYSSNTKFSPGDWRGEWTGDDWLEQNLTMLQKVKPIADATGLPLNVVALKFALHHPAVSVAIPGGRTPEQVEANIRAVEEQPLSQETLDALYSLWTTGSVKGTYLGSS